jgi:ribose 1,5-bisphosphokinase PhnN
MSAPFQAAVVTGPVGVGKSTILREADAVLVGAGIQHATIELEDIARFWGRKATEGGTRPDVAYRNLASLWANYRAAGADRLLLSLLVSEGSDLDPVRNAIPDAMVKVVQLQAPLWVIEERIRLRGYASGDQEISAARWWMDRYEQSNLADHVIDNSARSPRDVAIEVLRALDWLK